MCTSPYCFESNGIFVVEGCVLLAKEELLSLFDAYNEGEFAFAEIFLASGLTVKEFAAFVKENGIEVRMNFGFLDKGRGLSEGALERVLEMNEDGKGV